MEISSVVEVFVYGIRQFWLHVADKYSSFIHLYQLNSVNCTPDIGMAYANFRYILQIVIIITPITLHFLEYPVKTSKFTDGEK